MNNLNQDLTPSMQELMAQMARMQAELNSLKEQAQALLKTQSEQHARPMVSTTRRRMLGKLAGSLLAGGAALCLGLVSPTQDAQARLISNPVNTNSQIGAIIVPPNTSTPTGTIQAALSQKFGLVATDGTAFDLAKLPPYGVGVYGTGANYGVYGEGYYGVLGVSTAGIGVYASTNNTTYAAIRIQNDTGTGPALEIAKGAIQVTGAGVGSQTAAFIHLSTNGNVNLDSTRIDNPIINNVPGALLFVTHNLTPPGQPGSNVLNLNFAVSYGNGHWYINLENRAAFPKDLCFNIMAILP